MLYPAGPVISALRFAEDYANAVDALLQETPYHTFLTIVNNSYVGIESLGNTTPSRTDLRITIADGYRSYLVQQGQDDGYLYPQIEQISGLQNFASEGVLTSNVLVLGPLVLPYTLINGITGGTDPAQFQPSIGDPINNVSYWIWLVGPGINNSDNGNYYDIKEMKIDAMNNINYYLVLQAAQKPPLVSTPNIIN